MSVEWTRLLHYGLPGLLSLFGFYGLFFHKNILKKILSWAVFQTGILLFLLFLPGSPSSNPLPIALALALFLVSFGVLLVLLSFSAALRKKFGTLDKDEIAKRMGE